MKKLSLSIIICLLTSMVIAQDIRLPQPQKEGGKTLMEALAARKTNRSFSPRQIPMRQLGDLLWAATGVNREDGRLTAPTARNAQQIDTYVYTTTNVYLYIPKDHILKMVAEGDHRSEVGRQPFAAEAPVILVYVANYDKMQGFDEESKAFYGATDCGNIGQNVYLYCAANGLSTVELGSIQREKIKELLGFNGRAQLAQPVGFPKE